MVNWQQWLWACCKRKAFSKQSLGENWVLKMLEAV